MLSDLFEETHTSLPATGENAGIITATRLMSPTLQKRLALAAFFLMILTLLVTLVRPRIPGSRASGAELIGIAIQIILAIVAFRKYRQ